MILQQYRRTRSNTLRFTPLPGVATVLAVTRDERQSSGTETGTYYWYEPVEAGSLESLVRARGSLPLAEVATLAHHIDGASKAYTRRISILSI